MDLIIEKVGSHNWQKYREIRLKALREEPNAFSSTFERESGWNDEEWEKRATEPESVILLARFNATTVGIIGIYWKSGNRDKGEIWATFVDKNHRRKGIGKKLMNAIEQEAKNSGTKTLILGVINGQDAALSLYQGLGYTNVEQRNDEQRFNGTHFDSIYFEKNL